MAYYLVGRIVAWLQVVCGGARGADLVIEIPGSGAAAAEGGRYRLDYRPPHGSPAPNFTVEARASTINFQVCLCCLLYPPCPTVCYQTTKQV